VKHCQSSQAFLRENRQTFCSLRIQRKFPNPLLSCEQAPACILKRGPTVNLGLSSSVKQNNPQTWHENIKDDFINIPITFRGHGDGYATGNSR